MREILIKGANLVNEGEVIKRDLLIRGELIAAIRNSITSSASMQVIDAKGLHLLFIYANTNLFNFFTAESYLIKSKQKGDFI